MVQIGQIRMEPIPFPFPLGNILGFISQYLLQLVVAV